MPILRRRAESMAVDLLFASDWPCFSFPKWSATGSGRAFCFDRAF